MNIYLINKIYKDNINDIINKKNLGWDNDFEISQVVIPFSKICKSYKSSDIYSGSEKIPFKERDPEFKMILRQEFIKKN